MLSDKVKVASLPKYGCDYCRTLVATDTIEVGEAVWWYEPDNGEEETFYTWREISNSASSDALKAYSYMVGVDTYASTTNPEEDPSWFFNHCCNGNCCYEGDRKVVARRKIAAGEEVTYDYALTETEASFHAGLKCLCGGPNCRGELKFDDYRKPQFWRQYEGKTTQHIAARGQECGWLDSRLHVRRISIPHSTSAAEQKGVFALSAVPKGTLLAVFGGKTLGLTDASHLEATYPNYPYFLQVESGLWQIPHRVDTPDAPDYINHRCDANAGMLDSTQVVALRHIAAGEEITIDYATINDGSSTWAADNFVCGCGAAVCRGTVTSKDWEKKEVQDRCWPHFAPFVKRKVAAKRPDLVRGGSDGGGGVVLIKENENVAAPKEITLGGGKKSAAGTPTAFCITVKAG